MAFTSRCRWHSGEPTRLDQLGPGIGGEQKVAFFRAQRFDCQGDSTVFEGRQRLLDHVGGILHGLCVRDAGQQVSLFGGTQHQHTSAQIAAEPGQFAQVIARLAAHIRLGRGQVVAFGEGEQPVEPDDFQLRLFRLFAHLGPSRRRDVMGILLHRERRELDARVAALPRKIEGLFKRPILKRLVTDRELHGMCLMENGGSDGSGIAASHPNSPGNQSSRGRIPRLDFDRGGPDRRESIAADNRSLSYQEEAAVQPRLAGGCMLQISLA